MIKEALEFFRDVSVQSAGAEGKAQLLQTPNDDMVLLVKADGSVDKMSIQPPRRKHRLESIDQVGPFVAHMQEIYEDAPSVWFSPAGITVLCSDDVRRDTAHAALRTTAQYDLLTGLSKNSPLFDQREFIRLLRIDLDGARKDDRLLSWVRAAKFNTAGTQGGNIQHGRESLGRDIQAEALNAEECPETITLDIRVFDDPSLTETWPVRCAVEVHVQQARFQLTPLPLQLRNALDLELSAIGALLADQCGAVPIFRGQP